ncbi:MAG: iron chelate uptake ABC transporter family permease subunit [Bacillaceae bacterium]|nr:iron chelate uptake ABC transporter family permease subunit [Bacillaceae bacterium]
MVRRLQGIWIALFLMMTLIAALLMTGIGAVMMTPADIFSFLTGADQGSNEFILQNYRFPRMVMAILIGASLGVSGAILQGVIRNPLASPDVIGITKGAGLAAAIVIILFPKSPVIVLPLAAFGGAIVVALLLYLFAYKKGVKPSTLALSGIAIGAICQAGIQYLMVKFPVEVNAALVWLTGSLWGSNWDDIVLILPVLLIFLPISFFLTVKLDVLSLGDDVAEGLGIHLQLTRVVLLLVSVVLTAASVAVVGSMGFVGLIAPHMARQVFGPQHKYLLPASAIFGIVIITAADALGRGIAPPVEVPAGIFTAIIGAPYFLYLLRKMQTSR